MVSIGARFRDDKAALGGLAKSAMLWRRRLFALMIPIVSVLSFVMLYEIENRLEAIVAFAILALAIAWVQQSVSLGVAVLNVHHDASGLTRAGLGSAFFRLILVTLLCNVAPFALTALAINFAGMVLNTMLLSRHCEKYLSSESADNQKFSESLLRFSKPLIPVVVYYLLQGQLALLLLGLAGATNAVAEVGALGRLGQVLGVLGMVNGFFIQPYFSRIVDLRIFIKRAAQVIALLFLVIAIITSSTLILPDFWLAILGQNYRSLDDELVLAMAGAQMSIAGAVIYTLVIATRVTSGQWLQIVLGLIAQVVFLWIVGVETTHEALMLNLVPATVYLILQLGLLARILFSWKNNGYPT